MCAPISTVWNVQVLCLCQLHSNSDGNGVTPSCQQAKTSFLVRVLAGKARTKGVRCFMATKFSCLTVFFIHKLDLSAICQVITSSIETEPFFLIVTFILGRSQDWKWKWEKKSYKLILFMVVLSASTRWVLLFQSTELKFGNLIEWIRQAWCKEPRYVESKYLGMFCLREKKKCLNFH